MILVRAPLRVTLGGGPSDLPAFADVYGGLCLGFAIQQYVTVALHSNFDDDFLVKYSQIERVPDASQVKHPLVREAMKLMGEDGKGLELTSMSDVPAGMGLGSSSAFTSAVLGALYIHQEWRIDPDIVARDACLVEIEMAGSPIGRQDQYFSALGGCRLLSMVGGHVATVPVALPEWFFRYASLWATPFRRSASEILSQTAYDLDSHKEARSLAVEMHDALQTDSPVEVMGCLNQQWHVKGGRAPYPDALRKMYAAAFGAARCGVKLVGAGGGGCLLVLSESEAPGEALEAEGCRQIPLALDTEGVKVILC